MTAVLALLLAKIVKCTLTLAGVLVLPVMNSLLRAAPLALLAMTAVHTPDLAVLLALLTLCLKCWARVMFAPC